MIPIKMAVRCRIVSGKSFYVNCLLSSSRSCHALDPPKLYHQETEKHACRVINNPSRVAIPFADKFEQLLQPIVRFSHCRTSETPQHLGSDIVPKSFSSHILRNQDSPLLLLPQVENSSILLADAVNNQESKKSDAPGGSSSAGDKQCGRPSEEHLQEVYNYLAQHLPQIFGKQTDYKYFMPDLIIEDNLKTYQKTVGLVHLIRKISAMKIWGHLKFAYIKFYVLKMTSHPDEGCIKVRWRIAGITTIKAYFLFWKVKFWKLKETLQKEEELWYDGFMIFYLNSEGRIARIYIDKMMPDEDKNEISKDKKLPPLTANLAAVGVSSENLTSSKSYKLSNVKSINRSTSVFLSQDICKSNTSMISNPV